MGKTRKHRILVADDEPMIVALARSLLDELPLVEVLGCGNADEALEVLRNFEISVLVCDVRFPDASGMVVLTEARRVNPNTISLLTTGHPNAEEVINAVNEGGIWKVLPKPWDPDAFVATVAEAINRYEDLTAPKGTFRELATRITVTMTRHGEQAAPSGEEETRARTPAEKKSPTPQGGGQHVVLRKGGAAAKKIVFMKDARRMLDNRYRLLEMIGEGGLGNVHKAEDTLLNTIVAIKILSPEVCAQTNAIDMLKAEARIAMQLSHKHIVRLHNLQASPIGYFLVMEFVNGCSFRNVITVDGVMPLSTVLLVLQICADALGYAHRHGVLHRDLKPDNLMLTEDGVLKIIDFGIASLAGMRIAHVSGTPVYMSPEAMLGEPIDRTVDVYSLGVLTHELLSGEVPFPAIDMEMETILQLTPKIASTIPPSLQPVLEKAMARNAADRWPTVEDFAQAMHVASGVAWPG